MTRLFNPEIRNFDQFIEDYQAVTKYQIPNVTDDLERHVTVYIRGAGGPEHCTRLEIPDAAYRYGGRKKREFRFSFRWDDGAARFDTVYTGCMEVSEDKLDFWDIDWLSWGAFEEDYRAVAGDKARDLGEIQYDIYTRFSRSACVDGQEERIWLHAPDGNRHYFDFIFAEQDGKPTIAYSLSGKIEMQSYKVPKVRFDRWREFEEICATLLKPEGQPDFAALQEEFAKSCVATPGDSVNTSVFVDRRRSKGGLAYRFWFTLSNEDKAPVVTYRNYRVV